MGYYRTWEYEDFRQNGYRLKIEPDDDLENPRTAYDDCYGHMITWHRNYNFGEGHNFTDPDDFLEQVNLKEVFWLPIFLLDHSGLRMSTGNFHDPWDSGQVGWIYITKEEVRQWYQVKRITKKIAKQAVEMLKLQIEVYDQYLSGDVYFVQVTKMPEGVEEPEDLDDRPSWERSKLLDELYSEDVAASGGYYGSDMLENGIIHDILDDEALAALFPELVKKQAA
jgi:hypothetical protein